MPQLTKERIDLINHAIKKYNEIHGAEAQCTVLDIKENIVTLKFEGTFCLTCGVIDWVEDYVYILKDFGVEARIEDVEYHNLEGYVIARFKII